MGVDNIYYRHNGVNASAVNSGDICIYLHQFVYQGLIAKWGLKKQAFVNTNL
jgi:hypothetical protein